MPRRGPWTSRTPCGAWRWFTKIPMRAERQPALGTRRRRFMKRPRSKRVVRKANGDWLRCADRRRAITEYLPFAEEEDFFRKFPEGCPGLIIRERFGVFDSAGAFICQSLGTC